MPTFYPPGKRTYKKGGKVYANTSFVVRGRINGVEYEQATGCLSKKGREGAEKWWSDFEQSIWAACGRIPTRQTATFADACVMYRAARTLSVQQERYVARLETVLGSKLLSDIRRQTLIEAVKKLYPRCMPQTWNRHGIIPALAVIHNAADNDLCDWLRVPYFKAVGVKRPMIEPIQGLAVIDAATKAGKVELAALVTTLVYQGWRITETLRTMRADIDWKEDRVSRYVTKSKEWRITPIGPEVMAVWKNLPERDDGRLFSYGNALVVYRAIDALGLPFHYRPHMSRRGFATALKSMGHDTLDIMQAGNWQSERSVRVYIADDVDRVRRTLGSIRGKIRGKATDAA